jgi:hypothetical protein
MDTSGETHIDIVHNIYKRRLDLQGQPIEDPQKEHGIGETKKISNATKASSVEQVTAGFGRATQSEKVLFLVARKQLLYFLISTLLLKN